MDVVFCRFVIVAEQDVKTFLADWTRKGCYCFRCFVIVAEFEVEDVEGFDVVIVAFVVIVIVAKFKVGYTSRRRDGAGN